MNTIEKERELRLISKAKNGAESESRFKKCIEKYAENKDKKRLLETLRFAKQLKCNEPCSSSESYLAHPIRVTCLALQLEPPVNLNTLIIALLHNVPKKTNISYEQLKRHFSETIADSINILAVSRFEGGRSKDKGAYYELNTATRGVRIVKVLDKLDNLFLLCLNPDDDIRRLYLEEIEDHIFPIVDKELPELSKYFRHLTNDCRKIEYLDPEKSKRIYGKVYL